jgi:pyruvate dehydrogenase E2 component (dihydrolipoamide acetyltransferase)
MARHDIVMPQMGESITNGTITKWHKKAGDAIALDEILLEISTDKVESEIPAPIGGRIAAILFEEGDTVDVGIKIAEIEDDASVSLGGATNTSAPTKAAAPVAAAPAPTNVQTAPAQAAAVPDSSTDRRFYTPLVKAMAKEAGVSLGELSQLKGTGAGGRVNREDFENYLATRGTGAKAQAQTGASSAKASAPVTASAGSLTAALPTGRFEVIPMDNMRKAIARNMAASKLTSPHVNSIGEVDLSHLVKFREAFKNEFQKQEGFKLTYTPFIIYALIRALKEHPWVNASVDGDNIILKKDINLGFAVAVPGNGLVVPNVKSADSLNMVGLCRAVNSLAEKARTKKLTMDDLTGGTFTFTNVGSFGTLLATPVILQPQVAIYAAGVIQKRVVVLDDDSIAVRSMMYGTHTYDHRIIDGEVGGKFLETVHRTLRELDPKSLF